MLAAARGAGIVAVCDAATRSAAPCSTTWPGSARSPRRRRRSRTPNADRRPGAPEQRALLDRLAAGDTIAAAAAAEFLSLRTANRRIAEARALFGVRTTREAVLAYLRQRRPD